MSGSPWTGGVTDPLRRTLRELRRTLHRNPELSLREHETTRTLRGVLTELGAELVPCDVETGCVARVPGRNREAPPIALRGDIDALPIPEETGLEYASSNPGVMHACGHDIHASWAVGAAALLLEKPAETDVLVVLQAAEELGVGARSVLKSGVLDGVAAIFGGHVDMNYPVGEVVAIEGSVGAAADTFFIDIRGQGAHGARPHLGRDPILAGSALVQSLQTVVSRRLDPGLAGVLSVCTFQAGDADNVIPETARLSGTLRSNDPETRQLLETELTLQANATAELFGVEVQARVERGTPPVVNTSREASCAQEAVARVLGERALVPIAGTNMGGEDFGSYLEQIPGCFLRIGARGADQQFVGAHTPRFAPDEECLFVGASVLAECARTASA